MSKPFNTYAGSYTCKRCNENVKSARLWADTGDVTWQCSKKHITKVNLIPQKKKKADYE